MRIICTIMRGECSSTIIIEPAFKIKRDNYAIKYAVKRHDNFVMRKIPRVLTLFCGFIIAPVCLAMGGGPKTHTECLAKHMKDVESVYASSAVQQACNLKFIKATRNGFADCLLKNSDDIMTGLEFQIVVRECKKQELEKSRE